MNTTFKVLRTCIYESENFAYRSKICRCFDFVKFNMFTGSWLRTSTPCSAVSTSRRISGRSDPSLRYSRNKVHDNHPCLTSIPYRSCLFLFIHTSVQCLSDDFEGWMSTLNRLNTNPFLVFLFSFFKSSLIYIHTFIHSFIYMAILSLIH